jgi:hypothetical protein
MYRLKAGNAGRSRIEQRVQRAEQRAIVVEALRIFPNVWEVYRRLGKLIDVSYGSMWKIAREEGIELIRFDRRNTRLSTISDRVAKRYADARRKRSSK